MSANLVAAKFLSYSGVRLRQLQKSIAICCDKLNDEQMLVRAGEFDNSVTNLLLHLAGNMRQWVMHGMAEMPDVRRRDAEFTLTPQETPAEARLLFDATILEAADIIEKLDPERLMDIIDPQPTGTWRNPTIVEAVYKVVGHVEYHAGQIVIVAKRLSASDMDLTMPRKR